MEYQILKPHPDGGARCGSPWRWCLAAAAAGYLVGHHRSTSGPGVAAGTSTTRPAPSSARPLTVVSTVPAAGATDVPSDQVVTVTLSAPVADTTGLPVFDPPVAGSWRRSGPTTLSFAAAAPFVPTTTETLTIPAGGAGGAGVRSTSGAVLAAPVTVDFSVAQASTERLQQLLAQLGYLPLAFTPTGPAPAPAESATAQPGTFTWRWSGLPPDFTSQWVEGSENVITKAALMSFQSQHGLVVDALAGRQVWEALLADAGGGKVTAAPYVDVLVSKQIPETLTLYENGTPGDVRRRRQHGRAGCGHGRRDVRRVRARDQLADAGHQSGRVHL